MISILSFASLAASEPSQVLVLGPHHSATSIVSRALGHMGLYLGAEDELLLQTTNPLKYWERQDVVEVNKQRLEEATPTTAQLPSFVGYGFQPAKGMSLSSSNEVSELLITLNKHRPWATKDPRLSLLVSEWLPLLDKNAVCVLTVPSLPPHHTS